MGKTFFYVIVSVNLVLALIPAQHPFKNVARSITNGIPAHYRYFFDRIKEKTTKPCTSHEFYDHLH